VKITNDWLIEKNACSPGKKWFNNQNENDGIKVVKKLIAEQKLEWANWLIVHVIERDQDVKYAVFSAKQVTYLWKDKYPDKYKIWKQWVDDGCPADAYAAAAAADAAYAAAAYDAAYAAYAAYDAAIAAGAAAKRNEIRIKILNYGLKLLTGDINDRKKIM